MHEDALNFPNLATKIVIHNSLKIQKHKRLWMQ